MDGNRTLIELPKNDEAGPIYVTWKDGEHEHSKTFHDAFVIGRSAGADVSIDDVSVSREHARLYIDDGTWHIADLGSSNGTFLDWVRVRDAVVPSSSTIQLGNKGPRLSLVAPDSGHQVSAADIADRYLADEDHAEAEFGDRTIQVRALLRDAQVQRRRRYNAVIAGMAVLALVAVAVVGIQYQQIRKTRDLATDIFYSMKSVEVQMAQLESAIVEFGDEDLIAQVRQRQTQVADLEAQYDRFLSDLDVLGPDISEEDRIILRVARMFGESELTMPDEFRDEVKNYINKWRTSQRLVNSIERLQLKGLTEPIAKMLLDNGLPPQFLYVALQESGFKYKAVGPKTRFGIAKGMWQFIPTTARRYGLRTGPLVELPVHDPKDDRYDPLLASNAAANYLRDIYSRDAQASGLLVIASYNWGPNNIRRRIRQMPDNPRERNFWELLKQHEIPKETYNYVFFIFSAIVIAENPSLFGFDFENPLADIEEKLIET